MRCLSVWLFVTILLIFANRLEAQEQADRADSTKTDSTFNLEENILEYTDPIYVHLPHDSIRTGPTPTVALFKSMLIPGWGQISNRKYIKAGLIIGWESILIGSIIHYSDKTKKAWDDFSQISDSNLTLKQKKFDSYQDAKNDRNLFYWYLGTTIFLSMFDAFVDAHLSDFPKKDQELSLQVRPEDLGGISIRLALNF